MVEKIAQGDNPARRESLVDFVAAAPPKTGDPEQDILQITEWPLYYDLRPRGEAGFTDSAAAREEAQVRRYLEIGILAEGILEGEMKTTILRDGKDIEITIFACQPISMQEMVPHGNYPADVMVTPLWRSDRPLGLLKALDMRPKGTME